MNLLKKAVLAILLMLPLGAMAQGKIGHVSTQKLMEAMPEVKKVQAKLDTIKQQYQASLKELSDEYQKKVDEYQKLPKGTTSEVIMNAKVKEIQQLEERIRAFQEDAQSDIQKKTEELMGPILKKVNAAIQDIASSGKYDLIIDSSQQGQGVILYAAPSDDITDQVKKKLGL